MHVEPARQFNAASRQLPLSVKVRSCANRFEGTGDLRVIGAVVFGVLDLAVRKG